jgi:hypothetical protein
LRTFVAMLWREHVRGDAQIKEKRPPNPGIGLNSKSAE